MRELAFQKIQTNYTNWKLQVATNPNAKRTSHKVLTMQILLGRKAKLQRAKDEI